jgi:hypothetical protein
VTSAIARVGHVTHRLRDAANQLEEKVSSARLTSSTIERGSFSSESSIRASTRRRDGYLPAVNRCLAMRRTHSANAACFRKASCFRYSA